jgi:hypothetical protein
MILAFSPSYQVPLRSMASIDYYTISIIKPAEAMSKFAKLQLAQKVFFVAMMTGDDGAWALSADLISCTIFARSLVSEYRQ